MLKDLQRSASVFALAMLATSPQSVLASEAEIYSLISRAVELGNGGNHHAAIEVMQRALGATSAEYGDQSTEMGEALIAYGKLLFAMRRHGEAVEVHERALAILSSHYGEKSLDLAEARHRLGVSYLGAGRFGDAINTFALIGRVYLATIGKGDPRFVALQIDIFAAYSEVAEPQKTIEMGSRLLKNATIMHGAQSEEVMRVRSILAGTLRTAGQYGRAAEEYIEISRFVEDQRGLADPLTLEMVGSAAYMLLETPGREVEALEYADKAEKVYRRLITAYGETMADQLQVSRDRLDYLGTAVIRTDALWFHGRESRDVLSDVTEQVQRAFLGKTSEAVAEAAARRAVGKRPRLAKMLDDRELYEREYQQIAAELQASFSGDRPNTRLDVTELRAKLDRTSDRISTVNRRIDRLAPGLNSLISNEPLALKEAQGMLRKDEAVLMTMPGILGYHVVLLTRDAVPHAAVAARNRCADHPPRMGPWHRGRCSASQAGTMGARRRRRLSLRFRDRVYSLSRADRALRRPAGRQKRPLYPSQWRDALDSAWSAGRGRAGGAQWGSRYSAQRGLAGRPLCRASRAEPAVNQLPTGEQ